MAGIIQKRHTLKYGESECTVKKKKMFGNFFFLLVISRCVYFTPCTLLLVLLIITVKLLVPNPRLIAETSLWHVPQAFGSFSVQLR